jgi:sec-independent protein translocase protein TatA
MPFNLSSGEILVLLIVAIIIFGGRLPDVARKVGKGLTQFRRGMDDEMRRIDLATRVEPHPGRRERAEGAECEEADPEKPAEPAEKEPG